MWKILLSCLLCLVFLSACSPYKTIWVKTLRNLEIPIPASCSSWRDGCNIYCRVGPVEYETLHTEKRCIQANLIRPKCADNDQDAQTACREVRCGAGSENPDPKMCGPQR